MSLIHDQYQIALLSVAQFLGIVLFILTHKYAMNYRRVNRLAKRMHSIPRSKIGTSLNHYAEIEGESFSPNGQTIKSPFSGQDCIFWCIRLVNPQTRHVQKVAYSQQPFFIKDDTGKALICSGRYTEILLGLEQKNSYPVNDKFQHEHREFLETLKINDLHGEFEEIIIPQGTQMYATGNLIRTPGRNYQNVARALKFSDLPRAADCLNSLGIEATITKADQCQVHSVTGEHIPNLEDPVSLSVRTDSTDQGHSHYLYGTPQKPMFISVITETMIDDNQAVVMYKSHPIAEEIITLSAALMVLIIYKTF